MMLLPLSCPLFVSFSSTILAKPLRAADDQTLQSNLDDLRLPSQPLNQLLTSNATLPLLNVSGSNELSVTCNGDVFGFKPDIEDCTSALRHHRVGRAQINFGTRGSSRPEKFIALPYRLMGDQALCYLQPVLLNGAEFGSATVTQVRDAASDLLLKCASSAEQGGIANNLGNNRDLALTLGTYKPNIECRGAFPHWRSCRDVLSGMPASTETLVFGPAVDPNAQVIVPHFIESDDRECLSRLWYTRQQSDLASWYKVWEAVTAVYSVCARNQQKGTIRGLGEHGNLFLTMTSQVGSSSNILNNDTTYIIEDKSVSGF